MPRSVADFRRRRHAQYWLVRSRHPRPVMPWTRFIHTYDANVTESAGQAPVWADWLIARMLAAGFDSNSALARNTGVPDSVISRWRTSGTVPSIAQLRRLQSALQVPLLELVVAAGHLTAEEADLTSYSRPVRIPRDARDVIRQDPALDDDLKHLLEVQYDAMLLLARARAGRSVSHATDSG
jgi:transcriptional regulator with XRE-family HTH domain